MNKEKEIYDYLAGNHIGKANAVHSKVLEKHFGISSRTIRRYIGLLRKSGIPICSDDSGYWIGADSKEVNKTIKRLGDFVGEVNSARTGLAFATIQMRSVTRVTEESIQITVKVS